MQKKHGTKHGWNSLQNDDALVVVALGVLLLVLVLSVIIIVVAKSASSVTEIAVALVGLTGVCVTAFFGYRQTVDSQEALKQAEREIQFQSASLDFASFLSEWGSTMLEIEKLMADTEIDRFLILRAWNGYMDPRWTTAVLQVRRGQQELVSYVHFELDTDYVERLREVVSEGEVVFDTDTLPDGASIKKVYQMEGVKTAAWYRVASDFSPSEESQAITYCSFASHTVGIEPHTLTKCGIIANRLKGVAAAFK